MSYKKKAFYIIELLAPILELNYIKSLFSFFLT